MNRHIEALPQDPPSREADAVVLAPAELTLQYDTIMEWARAHGVHLSDGNEDATPDDAFLAYVLDADHDYAARLHDAVCKDRARTAHAPERHAELLAASTEVLDDARRAFDTSRRTLH